MLRIGFGKTEHVILDDDFSILIYQLNLDVCWIYQMGGHGCFGEDEMKNDNIFCFLYGGFSNFGFRIWTSLNWGKFWEYDKENIGHSTLSNLVQSFFFENCGLHQDSQNWFKTILMISKRFNSNVFLNFSQNLIQKFKKVI